MDKIRLQIVTPEATVYDGMAAYAELPLENGSVGVLANHAPLIGAVTDGTVLTKGESGEVRITVGLGVVSVANNVITLLTRSAAKCEE